MATASQIAAVGNKAIRLAPETVSGMKVKNLTPSRGENGKLASICSNDETRLADDVPPVRARDTSAKHNTKRPMEIDRKNPALGSLSKTGNLLTSQNPGAAFPIVSPAAAQATVTTLGMAPGASGKTTDAEEHPARTGISETADSSIREVPTAHTLTPSPQTVLSNQTAELISLPPMNEAVPPIQNAPVSLQEMVPESAKQGYEGFIETMAVGSPSSDFRVNLVAIRADGKDKSAASSGKPTDCPLGVAPDQGQLTAHSGLEWLQEAVKASSTTNIAAPNFIAQASGARAIGPEAARDQAKPEKIAGVASKLTPPEYANSLQKKDGKSLSPSETSKDVIGIDLHSLPEEWVKPPSAAGTSVLPSHQDGHQTARTDPMSVTGFVPGPNYPDFAGSMDLGKDDVKKAADTSDDSTLNCPVGSSRTTGHSTADFLQGAVSTPGAGDSSASQVVLLTAPLKSASDDATANQRAAAPNQNATLPNSSRPDAATIRSAIGEPVMALGVNAAKVIQTIRESEMRVGMHSSEFGNISVRTSVSQQQLFAQISVDHSDLSRALTAQLPAMQARLGDASGLHTLIEINNLGSSLSGGTGHSSQAEPEQFRSSQRIERAISSKDSERNLTPAVLITASNRQRLDIRA